MKIKKILLSIFLISSILISSMHVVNAAWDTLSYWDKLQIIHGTTDSETVMRAKIADICKKTGANQQIVDRYYLDPYVYKEYGILAYNLPNGDFYKTSLGVTYDTSGNKGEYKYLGLNGSGLIITNDRYFNGTQKVSFISVDSYKNTDWKFITNANVSWSRLTQDQLTALRTKNFSDSDYSGTGKVPTTLTDILGSNLETHALVQTPPSFWDVYGSVRLEYGVSNWNTVIFDSLIPNTTISANIDATSTFTMEADKDSIDVPYTLSGTVGGDAVNYNKLYNLKGMTLTSLGLTSPLKDFTDNKVTKEMSYSKTFQRSALKEGTNKVTLTGTATITTKDDRDKPKSADASKLVTIIVKPKYIPPTSGQYTVRCYDMDLNQEIPDTGCTYTFGYCTKSFTVPTSSDYLALANYDPVGANVTDNGSVHYPSAMIKPAATQTATISINSRYKYIYFWYKKKPNPPPPPVITGLPPTAILNNTNLAYAGDDVSVDGSYSYDTDGYITGYSWSLPGIHENTVGSANKGTVWYESPGNYNIGLTVTDDSGMTDSTSGNVKILESSPQIDFKVLATRMKENRKITLDVSDSKSPKRFPIDWSLTGWKIEPVTGSGATSDYGVRLQDGRVFRNICGNAWQIKNSVATDTGISFESILKGQNKIFFQARDSGQYKITVSLTDKADFGKNTSYTDSVTKLLEIPEDVKPIASFSYPTANYRDIQNPTNPTAQKYGKSQITCTSTSPDGDTIGIRNWTFKYDEDNDGNVEDDGTKYPYTGNDAFLAGHRLIANAKNDPTPEIWSYDVGEFIPSLEVTEVIPDTETIKELLQPNDYRTASSSASTPLEFKNTAPVAGFILSKKKNVDIVVVTDYEGQKNTDLKTKLNEWRAEMLGNDVNIKYYYVASKKKFGTQSKVLTEFKYIRRAWISYTETGYTITNGTETGRWTDRYKTNFFINLEECWSNALTGFVPTEFYTPANWNYWYQDYKDRGDFSTEIGTRYYLKNPNSTVINSISLATKSEFSYSTSSGCSSGITVNSYSPVTFSQDSAWFKSEETRNVTGNFDINGVNFDYLDDIDFRMGSEKLMLIFSDSTGTDYSVAKSSQNCYSFQGLNNSVKKFVKDNNMSVYTVLPDSILDIKFNANNYSSNISSQQCSLNELLASSPVRHKTLNPDTWQNELTYIAYSQQLGINSIKANNNVLTLDLSDTSINEDVDLGYYPVNQYITGTDGNTITTNSQITIYNGSGTLPLQNGLVVYDALSEANNGKIEICLGNPSAAGNTFRMIISGSAITTPKVGTDVSSWWPVKNGDTVPANTGDYVGVAEVDNNNRVVRFTQILASVINE